MEVTQGEVALDKERESEIYTQKSVKFVSNFSAGIGALLGEGLRYAHFNQRGREHFGTTSELPAEPLLTIMQSLGDTGAGFFASALTYEAIDFLSTPFEMSGKKVSEELKIGAAVFVGISVIIAHEKGRFMSSSKDTDSTLDILGGAIGPVAFVGFQILLNRFIQKMDTKIKEEKDNLVSSAVKISDLDYNIKREL